MYYLATGSSVAGIITASSTVFIAATGLLAGLAAFYQVVKPVRKIHQIVNSQRTEMRRYIKLLSAVLTSHGIDIPIDESIDNPDVVQ